MGKLLRRIAEARDLDVYATTAVALVMSVLSYFNAVPPDKLAPLVLAVLAVMSVNGLTMRRMLGATAAQQGVRLETDFAPDLIERRNHSMCSTLVGVSLSRTIETSFGAFQGMLASGGTLRVLLTDPNAEYAALCTRGQIAKPGKAELRREIMASLAMLGRLGAAAAPGTLEVRLTGVALKFGVNHVDIGTRDEALHVQFYSYNLAGESRPILVVRPRDGHWFECFADQVDALWADARPAEPAELAAR